MGAEEQGAAATSGRYLTVNRVLVFIRHEDAVLLIRGAATKNIWPGRLNGIGGHIERGESVAAAAHREIAEETGLTDAITQLALAGIVNIDAGAQHPGIMMFVFGAVALTSSVTASHEGELVWCPLPLGDDENYVPDVPDLIKRAFAARPGRPFFGRYWYEGDLLCREFEPEPGLTGGENAAHSL